MIATVALSRAKQQVFSVGAKQGTVAYDFIECYEQLGSGAPQASTPTPEVSVEVSNTPELTPGEEYRNELATNAAEEFFPEDNSTASEIYVKPQEKPEPAPEPKPERDMPQVLKDRAELLEYVMRLHNSKDSKKKG